MTPDSTRRVLVLDDDDDFTELLCDFLETSTGAECLAVHSVAELTRDRPAALACDLAVIDVNLGPNTPSGIDAIEWLRSQAFTGRIVVLTGHASRHPELMSAGVEVLEKPVPVRMLAALVDGTAAAPHDEGTRR